MKKKRVNSEKGKGMKFPFVRSPSFRIGKNEEFGFASVSPILRARVSSDSQFFELELCQQPRKLGALA